MMRKWIWTAFILVAGCTNTDPSCGNRFLVLWPVGDGQYRFEAVELSTLNSPYQLSGPAAKVYSQAQFDPGGGYRGRPAQPNVTRSGDVCVPQDVESSMAVAAYAHFERLLQFEQKLGTAQQIPWPRSVGVEVALISRGRVSQNNAHYFSEADTIAVVPYAKGGLPTGLNPGILAHEHFHAHFQHQVYNRISAATAADRAPGEPTIEDIDNNKLSMQTARGVNSLILRGWNEGLADFYAAIYTRRTDFFLETLPVITSSRDLAGPLILFPSSQAIGQIARAVRAQGGQVSGPSYDLGTAVARVLYRLAYSGVESPDAFLARVLSRLKDIPARVSARFDSELIEFEDILPILLTGFPMNKSHCQVLEEALSKPARTRSFPQCSRL